MKKTLILSLLAFMPMFSFATNVSGIISTNTTWTKANNPYIVTANLLVDEGATLTIEPGVVVQVDKEVKFYVDGGIKAEGTATDRIIFTSNMTNPGKDAWGGLKCRHEGVADSAIFRYCDVEYAGINVDRRPALITHSKVRMARMGLQTNEGNMWVFGNLIDSCDYGIRTFKTYGGFAENEIKRCYEYSMNITFVFAMYQNNYIHDNPTGMYVSHSSPLVGNGEISGNKFINNYYAGIFFSQCHDTTRVSDNIFAYNKYGLKIHDSHLDISHNTIKYNEIGVFMGWCQDFFTFEYNCIDSNKQFNLKNTSDYDLTFRNNYWGTTDSATIHSRIFDFKDDFVSGKIRFMPHLSDVDVSCAVVGTPPPVTGIRETSLAKEIVVYPNPFSSVFTVTLPQATQGNLDVFSITGSKIMSVNTSGKDKVTIDMSAYPGGLYIYSFTSTTGKAITGKIIKQ